MSGQSARFGGWGLKVCRLKLENFSLANVVRRTNKAVWKAGLAGQDGRLHRLGL